MTSKIKEFDVVNGSWEAYCDRVEMLFLVNKVGEELKVPTLISVIGEPAYELMLNLCSPRKPKDMKFQEVKSVLDKHLLKTPSFLAERYGFRLCKQLKGQSVNEYVEVLKKMSRHCQFNATLNDNLRDQLVCGLEKEVIRRRLFMEDNIDFEKAVTLAKLCEAAERDAAVCVDVTVTDR